MNWYPHLAFNGQCEAAFRFYERCLGGKVAVMLTWADSPMASDAPPGLGDKILHATLTVGDNMLAGSDNLPGQYQQPQGFHYSLTSATRRKPNAFSTRWRKTEPQRCRFRRPSGPPVSAC